MCWQQSDSRAPEVASNCSDLYIILQIQMCANGSQFFHKAGNSQLGVCCRICYRYQVNTGPVSPILILIPIFLIIKAHFDDH